MSKNHTCDQIIPQAENMLVPSLEYCVTLQKHKILQDERCTRKPKRMKCGDGECWPGLSLTLEQPTGCQKRQATIRKLSNIKSSKLVSMISKDLALAVTCGSQGCATHESQLRDLAESRGGPVALPSNDRKCVQAEAVPNE
eukprot:433924-Amphidinium_carterae.1